MPLSDLIAPIFIIAMIAMLIGFGAIGVVRFGFDGFGPHTAMLVAGIGSILWMTPPALLKYGYGTIPGGMIMFWLGIALVTAALVAPIVIEIFGAVFRDRLNAA